MAKISLYDIFTGSNVTKWLEPAAGISLDYSADYHSVLIGLSGDSVPVDISLDLNPTLGGDLNTDGHSIISGPGQDIIIQPGTGGHLILNGLTFPDGDGDAGDLLGTDGNGNLVWYKVPGITDSQAGLSYYVDQSVLVSGDGTKEEPFQTLQEALDIVDDNDTIIMYEGSYVGDHSLSKSLNIKAIDGQAVDIFGITTIANNVEIKTTNINFENNTGLAVNNTGSLEMIGGSLIRVNAEGVISEGFLSLNGTFIRTRITANSEVEMTNVNSDGGLITSNESLIIHSAIKAPMVDHVAGWLEIRNAPTFDFDTDNSSIGQDNSIKSTAVAGFMLLDNISLKQTIGWSKIAKTGTCDWVINNVGRNPLDDVLTGDRRYFITEASDLSSYYSPTNYSITSNVSEIRDIEEASITDHLIGIDNSLAKLFFSPSNSVWVAANAGPSGNGSKDSPFQSVSQAVSSASPGQTIFIYPGQYENETVVIDKDLFMQSIGDVIFESSTIEIIDGAFLELEGIDVVSNTGVPFTVTLGHFIAKDCSFDAITGTAIEITELTSDSELRNCFWNQDLVNNDPQGHELLITGVNSETSNIVTSNSGSVTIVRDSAAIGKVTHTSGTLEIINVGQITKDGSGTSIVSTAPQAAGNYLYITNSSTRQPDGSYGQIDKSGTSDYKLGINDFGTNDNFNGDGDLTNVTSDQVEVTFTPTAYTPDSNSLTDHLEQIDVLLSEAIIKPSRLYYVDTIDGLNEVYESITETTFGFDSTIYITPGAIAQFILNTQFVPGINLMGTGSAENVIVQMPNFIPHLIISSAGSGMVHETLWRDIKLNSSIVVSQTLSDDEMHFENMTINGDMTINSGKVIIRNTRFNGNITVAGGHLEMWNCEMLGTFTIGSGDVYINGMKQNITETDPGFTISGGEITIDNLRASNTMEVIFRITGGKTIVTSLLVGDSTSNTVIHQDIGGTIHIGVNNITLAGKTISGTVSSLGYGV